MLGPEHVKLRYSGPTLRRVRYKTRLADHGRRCLKSRKRMCLLSENFGALGRPVGSKSGAQNTFSAQDSEGCSVVVGSEIVRVLHVPDGVEAKFAALAALGLRLVLVFGIWDHHQVA